MKVDLQYLIENFQLARDFRGEDCFTVQLRSAGEVVVFPMAENVMIEVIEEYFSGNVPVSSDSDRFLAGIILIFNDSMEFYSEDERFIWSVGFDEIEEVRVGCDVVSIVVSRKVHPDYLI